MGTTQSGRTVTAWVGWIWFAALVMIMNGTFNLIDGLVALFKDEVYVASKDGLVAFDFTAWGWILLILGAIQLLAGVWLMRGAFWARVTAIMLALLSAIVQIGFITAFPFWSLTIILLDILVIWALVVHGGEAEAADSGY